MLTLLDRVEQLVSDPTPVIHPSCSSVNDSAALDIMQDMLDKLDVEEEQSSSATETTSGPISVQIPMAVVHCVEHDENVLQAVTFTLNGIIESVEHKDDDENILRTAASTLNGILESVDQSVFYNKSPREVAQNPISETIITSGAPTCAVIPSPSTSSNPMHPTQSDCSLVYAVETIRPEGRTANTRSTTAPCDGTDMDSGLHLFNMNTMKHVMLDHFAVKPSGMTTATTVVDNVHLASCHCRVNVPASRAFLAIAFVIAAALHYVASDVVHSR